MRGDSGTLRVRNLEQKIMWEYELCGQLSDGRWENSRPMDHWMPWCDATVVVDPEHLGRDFYAQRDGYCFTEKELLSIVGPRMLRAVQLATGNDAYSEKDMVADLRDLRKTIKLRVEPGTPVPPQPAGRETKARPDGCVESLTVYVPPTDEERDAIAADADRQAERDRQRVESLERKAREARGAADEAEAKAREARAKLGALL